MEGRKRRGSQWAVTTNARNNLKKKNATGQWSLQAGVPPRDQTPGCNGARPAHEAASRVREVVVKCLEKMRVHLNATNRTSQGNRLVQLNGIMRERVNLFSLGFFFAAAIRGTAHRGSTFSVEQPNRRASPGGLANRQQNGCFGLDTTPSIRVSSSKKPSCDDFKHRGATAPAWP